MADPTPRRHDHTTAPDGRPLEQQPAWRQDFPIDVERDNYVARRDFTKFMVLVSGSFVVGQAWIGLDNLFRRAAGKMPVKPIMALSDLPVGEAMSFRYPKYEHCILVRPDAETLVAFNAKCTHLHCPVRPVVERGVFQCPCHSGYFDLLTGTPIQGPPRRALHRITLEVRGGMIHATGVEIGTT